MNNDYCQYVDNAIRPLEIVECVFFFGRPIWRYNVICTVYRAFNTIQQRVQHHATLINGLGGAVIAMPQDIFFLNGLGGPL